MSRRFHKKEIVQRNAYFMDILIKPIGFIESPFEKLDDEIPIQPTFSEVFGTVVVNKEYQKGLKDIEGFSHLILIYWFDKVDEEQIMVQPFLDDEAKGIFSIRHPNRPNRLGLSIVELVRVEENKLLVKGIDVLNKTPLLDIKPFVPEFDLPNLEKSHIGWLGNKLRKERKDV